MHRVFILAAVACIGCKERPAQHAGPIASSKIPGATVVQPTVAAPDIDGGPAWQDPSCETDTSRYADPPGALVREYIARNDSVGYFAGGPKSNDEWLMRMTECPGHQGGSDIVAISARYVIDSLPARADSAAYRVRYDVIGILAPTESTGMRFTASPMVSYDTVRVVRTPFGWRLTGQVGNVFIAPGPAASQFHLQATTAAEIDSLARAFGRAARPDV
jgi:hypothetical protein